MADSQTKKHDYHLVDPSPWPLLASLGALMMAVGAVIMMRSLNGGEGLFGIKGSMVFFGGLGAVTLVAYLWWRDVITEAGRGDHTPVVRLHLRYGMLLFIASEVMFFVAWFWAYFDASLFPNGTYHLPIFNPDGSVVASAKEIAGLVERNALTGGHFPPQPNEDFKHAFNPWGLPLVNTLILLLSGCTVTWAHHELLEKNRTGLKLGLLATVLLGLLFTACQAFEYSNAGFKMQNNIYGSTFFMATGFHGFHVIIGTIFLAVCLFRAMGGAFTIKNHFGFEAAAWYWHFVDVVWLFLFAAIYVWGTAGGTVGVH